VDVLARVRCTVDEHGLLAPGDTVVVGVSGGPDSLCLLHVLARFAENDGIGLHVAHLNHSARGPDSDADARFVAEVAGEWGLPATVERMDVPALAREHRLAFEEAARRVRYAFLARVAIDIGATRIAVGHNADDQAETVLMHVLRGSGPAGLRGMLPLMSITDYRLLEPFARKGEAASRWPGSLCIIRPLLETARADIERYCAEHHLEPRFDRSNLDTTYFRNRLRHDLLPLLETYNPSIRARLCHTAAVMAADYELLEGTAEGAWADTALEVHPERVVFSLEAWRTLAVALQRATLRRAVRHLRASLRDLDFVHVEDARRVALRGETGARATLPRGLELAVGYDTLAVAIEGASETPPDEPLLWGDAPLVVQVPGETRLPTPPAEAAGASAWMVRVDLLDDWDPSWMSANPDPWTAYLDAHSLVAPLLLRSRRRGDRFRPQGMKGHSVKLSDYLVNRKVPRAWRAHLPLLVVGDTIVWVCGRAVGVVGLVGAQTRQVARVRFGRV
jgi:tRNA(Ile)-lysidine synthase